MEPICCSIESSHGARYVLFTLRTYLYQKKYVHSINIASTGGDAESSHDEQADHEMYETPPPSVTQETQTHEEEPLRGRGLRDHHGPRPRWEPSGRRERPPRQPRYRAHTDQ